MNRHLVIVLAVLAAVGIAAGLGACGGQGSEPTPGPRPQEPAAAEEEPAPGLTAAPPTPAEENRSLRAADGMAMLRVPAGEFVMGSDASPFAAERPAHTVYLDTYWMDRTEVSNAQYRRCVEAEICVPPTSWDNPDLSDDDRPVPATWGQAKAYCQWVGGRLPTEAEWEKAARGTAGRLWPWGDEYQEGFANVSGEEDGYGLTSPVGMFEAGASPYGLMDMVGNAAEWVADWYGADYYATAPARNPTGPANGAEKVYRSTVANGGGGPEKCRSVARYPADPEHQRWTYGFRCAVASPDQL